MLAAVLTLLSLAEAEITLESSAMRADRLVAELASQSGERLECADEVAAEPLVVQISNRPLAEVRERLARLLDAEWQEAEGRLILHRPPELRRKKVADEAKLLHESVEQLLSEVRLENAKLPPIDRKEAERFASPLTLGPTGLDQKEYNYRVQANPLNRAGSEMLEALGAARLTGMYVGERVVFSDSPNSVQRPLPAGSSSILARLRKGLDLLHEAKANRQLPEGQTVRIGGYLEIGPSSIAAGLGKTLFVLQRRGISQYAYTLTLVDREGKLIARASGNFPDRNRARAQTYSGQGKSLVVPKEVQLFAFLRKNAGYAAGGGPAAKLPDGTPIRAGFGVSFAESEGRSPDLGLGNLLDDPVGRDPLGLTFGPLIRQVAKERQAPLLATLSDDGIVALLDALQHQGVRTHDDLLDFLTQAGVPASVRSPHGVLLPDSGEWMLIRPVYAEAARKERFNRVALRTLVGQMREKETITLEDAAAYVRSSSGVPSYVSLEMMILRSAVPTIDRSVAEAIFSPALTFLAEMSPAQFQRLRTAGAPYSDLTPGQKETLRRWLYDDFSRTRPEPIEGPPLVFRGPLMTEPTELFPQGFPPATPVMVETSALDAVIARATTGFRYALNLDSLAWHDTMGAEGDFIGAKYSRHYVGFRPARQTRYAVVAHFGPESTIQQGTIETKPIEGKGEITRDQFPEEYRKRIELAKSAFRSPPRPPGGPPP